MALHLDSVTVIGTETRIVLRVYVCLLYHRVMLIRRCTQALAHLLRCLLLPLAGLSIVLVRRSTLKFLGFNFIFDVLNCSVLIFAQRHHVHLDYTKPFLWWIRSILAHESTRIKTLHYNTLGHSLALLLPIELGWKAIVFHWYVVTLILRPVKFGLVHHIIVRISQSLLHFMNGLAINWLFLTPKVHLWPLVDAIIVLLYFKFHLWWHIGEEKELIVKIVLGRWWLHEHFVLLRFCQILFVGPNAKTLSSDSYARVTKAFLIGNLADLLKSFLSRL